MFIALVLFAADIGSPVPLEQRVTALEVRMAALEAKCQCAPSAKAPVPVVKESLTTQQAVCVDGSCGMPLSNNQAVSLSGPQAVKGTFQPMNQGGCPNGQCSPQRGGFRLFRRR